MQVFSLERRKRIGSRLKTLRTKHFHKSREYMEEKYKLNPNSLKNIEDKYPDSIYIYDLCKKNPQINYDWIMEGEPHPMLKESCQ